MRLWTSLAGFFLVSGVAGGISADALTCQQRFEADVRTCKSAFDTCHCRVCPDSRMCGGTRNPNSCGAALNSCIATQRDCRARATQAKNVCLRR